MSTNCWAACTVATAAGAPASIRCSTADSRPRSRASPAVVESTSALTPVAAAARSVDRPAAVSAAATKRPARRDAGLGHVAPALRRELHGAGRPDHGPQDGAGDTGVPVSATGPVADGREGVPVVVVDMGDLSDTTGSGWRR